MSPSYSGRPLEYHHQQPQQAQQHHLYSQSFSPSSTSPFQRHVMAPPYNGSIASPGTMHAEAGSSSAASRLGDTSRYDEEEGSPASLNQYSPSKETESRGTKRKSLPKQTKSEEGASLHNKDEEQSGGARRKKKAVSCESCRRRKLKCDRGWPVSQRDLRGWFGNAASLTFFTVWRLSRSKRSKLMQVGRWYKAASNRERSRQYIHV